MSGSHDRRTVVTTSVAGAGLVLGHSLAYALATPQAHAREQLLHATGHGYLPFATQVAMLAAALSLAALFLSRLGRHGGRGSFGVDVARLAGVQSAAFVAMEVGERLASGASLLDLVHGPLLAIGLVVQLVVAVVGALALRLTERAAECAESLGRSPANRASATLTLAIASAGAPRRPTMRAPTNRAPPSSP
jgi:hypothetical protein